MKSTGDLWERRAAQWLEDQGLVIVERNFRCKTGEIDLIARHQGLLVFVEVRARSNPRFQSAAASVDRRKQQRLLRTAEYYRQTHLFAAQLPCRFDVVAFEPRQSGDAVRWIRSAFTY